MNDLPCPASCDDLKRWDGPSRLCPSICLFLLDSTGQHITGAAHKGKLLDQNQALELWQKHLWQPANAKQHWPISG